MLFLTLYTKPLAEPDIGKPYLPAISQIYRWSDFLFILLGPPGYCHVEKFPVASAAA